MRYTILTAAKWMLIGCLLIAVGCKPSGQQTVVLISGDTAGWITPCGCASNQSGGLARRATLVQQAGDRDSVLLIDAGGSAIGTGPYQTLKLESLLRGMADMGLAVHNLGGPETAFSATQLVEIGKETGVQFLSTNLTSSDGQKFTKVHRAERNGKSFAVAGVLNPALIENDQWLGTDPVSAVLTAFADVDADVKIVLAYDDEAGLRELAASLPEIDYIIGGPTGQAMAPSMIGPVTVMSATNKGKFMARITWESNQTPGGPPRTEIVEVKSELDEDQHQLTNLKDYYGRLEARDFTAAEAELVDDVTLIDASSGIAGSESCQKCHVGDDQIWHQSKHSHAWDVLVVKGAQFDPHCQQCHTTGYGLPGGFESVSLTAHRTHVGCENCHGPSAAHVQDPKQRTPFQAKQACLECHDHENSPNFDLETYWAKIAHSMESS